MEFGFTPTPADWQPEEEDSEGEDDGLDIRKKLFDGLETPARRLSIQKQPIVVYLRVRPKSKLEIESSDADCFHRISANELLAVPPRSSQAYKNKSGSRCLPEDNQKFLYTNIFETGVTQKEVFEETLEPTLKDFFDGQNCLVFTYGITNSGKTYTVTGTSEDPGLLPRSLDVIFNSLDERQLSSAAIKPKYFSDVTSLSQQEQEAEQERKQAILAKAREASVPTSPPAEEDPADGDLSTASKASSNYSKITDDGLDELIVHEDSCIELEGGDSFQYSLWVSFAEIYNECIYDLLADTPQKGRLRPVLKLCEDKNHNQFIKGLREVQVKSVEEARLLLQLGLRERRVAATRLNYQSSRSHSIYTIKLLKFASRDKPSATIVNRISIVDLAGAERSSKTGATGVRVKEAGNINNSLFTLGKCIEAMKHNQTKKYGDDRVVPFRESKLTRLFQNYFVGKGRGVRQGKITMIVNISNSASVFDETVHVLKFSALASKVIPVIKLLPAHPSAAALPPPLPAPAQEPVSARRSIAWESESEEDTEGRQGEAEEQPAWGLEEEGIATVVAGNGCQRCKMLRSQLSHCRKDAEAKVSALQLRMMEQECIIRKEVCREFGEQLIEIEERHSHELEEQAEDLHDMYQKRVELLQRSVKKSVSRKRRRPNEEDMEDSEPSLRVELANLKEKLQEMEEELAMERNRAAAEFRDASETYETKAVQSSSQLSEMSLKLAAARKAEGELRGQVEALQGELGAVRETLQEKDAELSSNRESLVLSQRAVAALTAGKEALESKLAAVESASAASLQELQAQVARLTTERETFAHELEQLQSATPGQVEAVPTRLSAEREALTQELEALKLSSSAQLEDAEARVAALAAEREALTQELEALKLSSSAQLEGAEARVAALTAEREALTQELEALKLSSSAQLEGAEARVAALTAEREALAGTVDALQGDTSAEVEILQCRISELTREKSDVESSREHLQQQLLEGCTTCQEKECELGRLRGEMESLLSQLSGSQRELASIKEGHARKLAEEHASAKKLELQLAELTSKNSVLSSELKSVGELCQTLKEYETTLEEQSARLRELGGERDLLQEHNEELDRASRELNLQLERVTSTREALNTRLAELDQKLREKEEELLSLTRASSGEHAEVVVLKGECEGLKGECEGLRREAEELKAQHQAQVEAIKGQHQLEMSQLTIRVRELSDQLGEREGASQEAELVRAQWSEEVESLRAQWSLEVDSLHKDLKQAEKKASKLKAIEQENKTLKKSQSCLKKEKEQAMKEAEQAMKEKSSLDARVASLEAALASEEMKRQNPPVVGELQQEGVEEEVGMQQAQEMECEEGEEMAMNQESNEEHIYEEPPELSDDPTIYESVDEGSQGSGELDRSKPFVPLLERSSQLVEESFSQAQEEPIHIDATPTAARKRGFKRKAKKRSIEMVEKEVVSPTPKRCKYPLRSNRKKPQRLLEDCENTPPSNKTRTLKKFWKKTTPCEATNKSPVTGGNSPVRTAATTGRKRKVIRKSQISEPLELMNSPAPGRNPLDSNARILLGRQLRPLRQGVK